MKHENKNQENQSRNEKYNELAKRHEPKRPVLSNCIRAFLAGGVICMIGQLLQFFFMKFFGFSKELAGNLTTAVLIIIAILLTGFGVYDHIAQWAGAGTGVPVTGFANTMASAALEHRSEGFVLGVGGNMFKIAGPVIVYGVFSAFVVVLIKIILTVFGVIECV